MAQALLVSFAKGTGEEEGGLARFAADQGNGKGRAYRNLCFVYGAGRLAR